MTVRGLLGRRWSTELSFAILLAVVALLASAFASPVIARAADYGSVYGVVTGRDGQPVENANVWLEPSVASVLTAADGSYVIENVPVGTYRIVAGHWPSWWRMWRELDTYAPNSPTSVLAGSYPVLMGTPTRADIQMRPAALIQGSCLKTTGAPAAALRVALWQFNATGNYWEVARETASESDGTYWFGVESGEYRISYNAATGSDPNVLAGFYDGVSTLEEAKTISASAGTTMTLQHTVHVGGQIDVVCRYNGVVQPITSTQLFRRDDASGAWTKVRDVRSGTLYGVPPGTYRVAAVPRNYLEPMRTMYYPASTTLEGAQDIVVSESGHYAVEVQTRRLEGITGVASSSFDGRIFEGIQATLWSNIAGVWTAVATATTGPAGTPSQFYALNGMDPGTYRVTFHDPLGRFLDAAYPSGTGVESAADIVVGQQERVSADIQLVPNMGTVRGYVRDAKSGAGVPDIPLALWYQERLTTITVTSDESGYYEIPCQEGLVAVEPIDQSGSYMFYGTFRVREQGVALAAGRPLDRDVVVAARPRVTGRVLDAETLQPIPGIEVGTLYGGGQNPVTTAADGSFSLLLLAIDYRYPSYSFVEVQDPAGRYLPTSWTQQAVLSDVITTTTVLARSPYFNDRTPPVTTSNARSSYEGTATVAFTATDGAGSGVAKTYFVIDGKPRAEGATARVGGLGTHTLRYWSVDNVGNVEATRTVSFTVFQGHVTLRTPAAPTTMYRGRSAKISGSYSPTHSGSYSQYKVTLRFYLKNSKGSYVYHHSVTPRSLTRSSGRMSYSTSVSLPHRGRWRVRASHACTLHTMTCSGYDYITVR